MSTKSLILIIGLTLVFCVILYVRSQKPSRRVLTVDPPETSGHVIGDGAWAIPPTKVEYPQRFPQRSILSIKKQRDRWECDL